ncbi:MAG: cellulase family glycosylhydrolase [Bacteroidales bacterium]|nr:cellulase family glycosylhydrolase [Bacteroidales bacterium]MBN2819645.1 cellulase family glycosylhydrolase [Bacteroidales bacterium]
MKIYGNFRVVILTVFAITLTILYSCKPIETKNDLLNPSGFEIKRGVNLSHWLSQDFGWVPKYTLINENDIKFIDSIGYDHVRIPIDEKELWDDSGKQIDVAFNALLSCLNWCDKYNLRAIVDLHIIRSHHFNAANEGGNNTLWTDTLAQNNFVNLWVQLSEKLQKYPVNMVAYELLNEVVAPEHSDWNKLLNRAITSIREKEPERVLVVGPNMWQIAPNLQYLELPENDKNIILSFHTYNPLAFTHYKANWTPAGDFPGKVNYPGQIISDEDFMKYIDTTNADMLNAFADARDIFNKQRLTAIFESGIAFADSMNLQLYCGEFGCLPTVERNERLQYYADIVAAFEENGIAWCNWEYKGDFGIYHFDTLNKVSLEPDAELIDILLNRE